MRRVAFGSGVIVLIALLAFTNLNTVFYPGRFESQFPAWAEPYSPVDVVVEDRTGLVAGIVTSPSREPPNDIDAQSLALTWMGGCDEDLVSLTLYGLGGRVIVGKQTVSNGCALDVGIYRTVVLTLRQPVAPSLVDFAALEASVR